MYNQNADDSLTDGDAGEQKRSPSLLCSRIPCEMAAKLPLDEPCPQLLVELQAQAEVNPMISALATKKPT